MQIQLSDQSQRPAEQKRVQHPPATIQHLQTTATETLGQTGDPLEKAYSGFWSFGVGATGVPNVSFLPKHSKIILQNQLNIHPKIIINIAIQILLRPWPRTELGNFTHRRS